MRFSVLSPLMPRSGMEAQPYADLVRHGPAARLWMGVSLLAETYQSFAFLAGAGYKIPVGTAVMLTPFCHPLEAAAAARSIALLTERPAVAGFGASFPTFVAHMLGTPYRRPATAARQYIADVRALISGERAGLPPLEHPPVEVGAGVLRPGMARAAGAAADVAITWMTPPAYIKESLVPALHRGAADRDAPPRVATVVHVAIARPGRDGQHLAYLAARQHLSLPHYTDMLCRAGTDVSPGDPKAGARRIVQDGIFLIGGKENIVDRLYEYEMAGVDELILNTAGVFVAEGPDAAAEDAAEILHEVDRTTPSTASLREPECETRP